MENRIRLRIVEKIQETATTTTLILQPLDELLPYHAGQFLTFIFENLGAKAFRRSYSFSSTPNVEQFPAITIKKIPNGIATRYLVEQTQVGDVLEALQPAGQFTLPESNGAPRDIFLIGGGSGITPLFSILKQVLHFESQSRVVLILANSNEYSIIFKQQLRHLVQRFYKRFKLIHFLSDTKDTLSHLRQAEFPAEIRVERLNNAIVQNMVERELQFHPKNAQFFLCGPKNLMLKASQMLYYLQFDERQIHQETFNIVEPYRPPSERYQDSLVQIQYLNQIFLIPVKGGQTILEAAENLGVELPYSCRSGICTACTGRCVSGAVEMYLPNGSLTTEMSNGVVFTCVGYPLTERVQLKIGL